MAQQICALPPTVVPFFALRIADLRDGDFSVDPHLFLQPEEAGAGPVTAADLARNHRERTPVPSFPFESVFADDHRMGLSMPLADELGSGLQAGDAIARDVAVPVEDLGEVSKSPFGSSA